MSVELVTIASAGVTASFRPSVGCELVALTETRSAVQLLARSPWGLRSSDEVSWFGSSEEFWMQRTAGGWSVQFPHAGAPSDHEGVIQPFHGEAGTVTWEIVDHDSDRAHFRTRLMRSPVELDRFVRVEDTTLVIRDVARNLSTETLQVSWGYHPTFGAPFLAAGLHIEIDADEFVIGREPTGVPTSALAGTWPFLGKVDLSILPDRAQPRALLAYLRARSGHYRLTNRGLGVRVEVRWPIEMLPNIWLWQELEGSSGYPWFGRAYVMGVEPQSMGAQREEPSITILGGESRSVEIAAEISYPAAAD